MFPMRKNYDQPCFVVKITKETSIYFNLSLTRLLPLLCKSQGAAGILQYLIFIPQKKNTDKGTDKQEE